MVVYSSNMDEPRDYHIKWSNSERERQMPYDHMLIDKINIVVKKVYVYIYLNFILCWSIADNNAVISLRWTEKGFSHAYTCNHYPQTPVPARLPYNIEQSSLCSRPFLVICFKYSNIVHVHRKCPNYTFPQSFPPATISSFSKSVIAFLLCK